MRNKTHSLIPLIALIATTLTGCNFVGFNSDPTKPNDSVTDIESNTNSTTSSTESGSDVSNTEHPSIDISTNKKPNKLSIDINGDSFFVGDEGYFTFEYDIDGFNVMPTFVVSSGQDKISIEANKFIALKEGTFSVQGTYEELKSNILVLSIASKNEDPYVNVNKEDFYKNYTPATSYLDSYYRTKHDLMSGSIEEQDQYATLDPNSPKQGDKFIRNSYSKYGDDNKSYYVFNSKHEVETIVYKDAAYVTLEEVAAYVIAFDNIPANYIRLNRGNPQTSPWGEYLRVNYREFSGDTNKYPFEPELPDISGIGGDTIYYEMDIGTTGTTCDPKYEARVYNDGNRITRGAARIVYSVKEGNTIFDNPNQKHVFYTDNHYNDFREYLNYFNGWGEIFGNITGGGELSSKTEYNPTPYISTVNKNLFA